MFISKLLKFLDNNNMLQTAVGFALATSMKNFITVFTDIIIDPILNKLVGNTKDKKIKIFGIEFKVGVLLIELIDFILVAAIMYIILRQVFNKKGPISLRN